VLPGDDRPVQAGGPLDARDVHDAALIIYDYIEGFHEGLEEGYVFLRLVRAGRRTGTVTTLLVQHARGRVPPSSCSARPPPRGLAIPGTRARLATAMQAFDRMYEPHEAREDTVVFPAFRQIVPAGELAGLGRHFADLEHQQFGTDEFAAMVARVASIEQNLGIYDLAQFTPQVTQYTPPAGHDAGCAGPGDLGQPAGRALSEDLNLSQGASNGEFDLPG
jgi:hemerythrin-like domain-containing protein